MKRLQAFLSFLILGLCLSIKTAQDEIDRISSMYVFSQTSDSDESYAHVASIVSRKK